jgi:hypothetical protein
MTPWEKPKYLRADILLKEYNKKVQDYEQMDVPEYYSTLAYIEEELILELAEKIKMERKNEPEIKAFGI